MSLPRSRTADRPALPMRWLLALGSGLLAAVTLSGCAGGAASSAVPTAAPTVEAAASGTPSPDPRGGATASGAGTASVTPADAGLGPMPTFLPSATAQGPARGSTSRPALSYPGSPVIVSSGRGAVTVEVDGPSVPAGTKVGAEQVQATFTVTFSKATARLDLADASFDVLDHLGTVHRCTADPALPRTIAPGQTVRTRLSATVPSGEGLLRFYPSGSVAAAGWDYVAETD
ncbi:hypothetical protein [Nigerium massiliense]|uniref:hypothetical protein n=1 Tax=Nigerium massiliense TaxID=1522317 RepID=UPI000694245A|nr:hypothetical protein [Nigerium massiliense]